MRKWIRPGIPVAPVRFGLLRECFGSEKRSLSCYCVRILARTTLRFDDYVNTEPSICRSHLDDPDHCLFQTSTNGASTTSPPSRNKRLFFLSYSTVMGLIKYSAAGHVQKFKYSLVGYMWSLVVPRLYAINVGIQVYVKRKLGASDDGGDNLKSAKGPAQKGHVTLERRCCIVYCAGSCERSVARRCWRVRHLASALPQTHPAWVVTYRCLTPLNLN